MTAFSLRAALSLLIAVVWIQAVAAAPKRTTTKALSIGANDGSITNIGNGDAAALFLSGTEALGPTSAFDYVPSSASLSSCQPQLTSGIATLSSAHALGAMFHKSVVLTTGNRNAAVISSQHNVMSSTAVACPRRASVTIIKEFDLSIFSFRITANKAASLSFWYALATNENATTFGQGFKDGFRLRLQRIVGGQVAEQILYTADASDAITGVSNQGGAHATTYGFFTSPTRTDVFRVRAGDLVQVTFEIFDAGDQLVDTAVYLAPVLGQAGSSAGDPVFYGADRDKFYFHGRRDQSFCIFSDKGLHINSHFIGKPAANPAAIRASSDPSSANGHDLTWMQSLTIFFPGHQIYIGALQEQTWSAEIDHLIVKVDAEEIVVPALKRQVPGSGRWESPATATRPFSIQRINAKNQAKLVIPGLLVLRLKIVPTKPDTWTQESCFAHLDVMYEFSDMTPAVDGVLGRTYRSFLGASLSLSESSLPEKKSGAYILKNVDDYWAPVDDEPTCRVGQYMEDIYTAASSDITEPTLEGKNAGYSSSKKYILCQSHPLKGGMACR